MKHLTIGTMTLKQLQEGMKLHEQIREVKKNLIILNNPTRRLVSMELNYLGQPITLESEACSIALEVQRVKLEEKLKLLKRKLELL